MLFYMRIPSFCLRGIVPTCKWQKDVARLGLNTPPSNLLTTWSLTSFKQGLATGCQQEPTMCSPLEHSEYILLQTNLLKDKTLGTLCEFGQVCLHILDNDIKVNEAVLFANALALRSHNSPLPSYIQVRDMKEKGLIKTGSFNSEEDQSILAQYHRLLKISKVDQERLEEEMYSKKKSRSFMLQRQLVGFYLLQELKDGDRRLPVEVFSRLCTLGSYGAFTKEEEAAIMAWVDQYGPQDWTKLALKLGRKYLLAGNSAKEHYQIMKNRVQKKKTGVFSDEELEAVIRDVFNQNPKVLVLTHMFSHGVDFGPIAESLNRSKTGVYEVFSDTIHPVLRRFEAGTLEKDVREDILLYAKSRDWKSSIEIDFEEMAAQEQFKGHTRPSLHRLFDGMLNNTNVKLGGRKSKKGITLSQVEEWWNTSERKGKTSRRKNREETIVQAYLRVKEDIKDV